MGNYILKRGEIIQGHLFIIESQADKPMEVAGSDLGCDDTDIPIMTQMGI